jgi:hypothetical protein
MYEDQLETILNHDSVSRKYFKGAFARDELPLKPEYPSCMIINNEPRSSPGGHWMALWYSPRGEAYFFDSYGHPPSYYRMQAYLHKSSTSWIYNKRRLQGSSEYCGLYCILFLLFKVRNKENEFFGQFKQNFDFNDNLLTELIKDFKS